MEAAGFVCCFLALQEKLGKGKNPSLWEALAPFVLPCKDLGRIPKGRKIIWGGGGGSCCLLWWHRCRARDFNISKRERPPRHCSRSPGCALTRLLQAVLKIGRKHHPSATTQSVARRGDARPARRQLPLPSSSQAVDNSGQTGEGDGSPSRRKQELLVRSQRRAGRSSVRGRAAE